MTWWEKPNQIVCLDYEDSRLYCSAISFISARQFFWVRPLMLTIIAYAGEDYLEIAKVVDLRFTADLIWPKNFFRPALDTEVIGLLWQLEELYCPPENLENARQELRCFMDKVWHHRRVSRSTPRRKERRKHSAKPRIFYPYYGSRSLSHSNQNTTRNWEEALRANPPPEGSSLLSKMLY